MCVCSMQLSVMHQYAVPSCANRFVTDLVLGRACLSNVKVVFWHVSERVNLRVSVLEYKLVT